MKHHKVKNPLTIFSIFAALVEGIVVVVLPSVPHDIQLILIWFGVLFPILLLFSFLFILYHKPMALYSPDDYRTDEGFLEGMKMMDKNVSTTRFLVNKAVESEPNPERKLQLEKVREETENLAGQFEAIKESLGLKVHIETGGTDEYIKGPQNET